MLRYAMNALAVVAIVAAAWFLFRDEVRLPASEEPPIAEPVPAPSPAPMPSPTPIVAPDPPPVSPASAPEVAPKTAGPPLPPLGESDPLARERAEAAGVPAGWIAGDHLLRRFSLAIDGAGRGDLPARALRLPRLALPYRVLEIDGRFYPDPRNARRFDAVLDVIEAIEPEVAVATIDRLAPLIETGLRELGRDGSARAVALDAIDRALSGPAAVERPELVRPNVLYRYADPALESLPALDKQLLRLGPRNRARLEAVLRDLRAALTRPAS